MFVSKVSTYYTAMVNFSGGLGGSGFFGLFLVLQTLHLIVLRYFCFRLFWVVLRLCRWFKLLELVLRYFCLFEVVQTVFGCFGVI